jgi:hypothetical protein
MAASGLFRARLTILQQTGRKQHYVEFVSGWGVRHAECEKSLPLRQKTGKTLHQDGGGTALWIMAQRHPPVSTVQDMR